MQYFTHKLLNEEQLKTIQKKLFMSSDWIDGKHSATGRAKDIKRNHF